MKHSDSIKRIGCKIYVKTRQCTKYNDKFELKRDLIIITLINLFKIT